MMISDLPGDLESDILSRVPTKSLANLQTTCKRWYTLLKDPKFVERNLGKSAREVILLMNSRVHSITLNLHGIHNGIDPYLDFRGKLNTLKDFKDVEISEIYHCDGLMLCVTKGITNTSIVVWNPCTCVTRCIKPRSCYKRGDFFALGYGNSHSSTPSYKVLKIRNYYGDFGRPNTEVELYEFSSDSWKVLDIDAAHDWNSESPGVSLKGNTYWIGFDRETGFYLLSFDFTIERFGRLPLSCLSDNWQKDYAVLSVVKDERLAVLYCDNFIFSVEMKIWVSNKIVDTNDMSWSNFLVVDLNFFLLPKVTSFLLDEENKVAVCCYRNTESRNGTNRGDRERTIVYIVGEDIYKEAYNETAKEKVLNWPLLVSYVPSLVQIPAKENETKGGRDGDPSS